MYEKRSSRAAITPAQDPKAGACLVGSRLQVLTMQHVGAALQKTCWLPKIGRGQAIHGEPKQADDTAFPVPLDWLR